MKRVAAAVATLPLALAACGGAETASPSRTAAHEEARVDAEVAFPRQAAAICAAMQRDAGVVVGGRSPSDAEFARLLARWRAGFDRLAKLEPPSARVKPFEQMIAHYRRMAAALASDDESVLADFAGAVVEGNRGSRAARYAGLPGCAFFPEIKQPRRDPEPVLVATRALVPPDARVIKADSPACNAAQSCWFEFSGSGSAAARLRSALLSLRSHGWTHVRTGRSPTGSRWATGFRNDYEAMIELLGERPPPHCAGAPRAVFGCSDSVWVHRVEIPDVLTEASRTRRPYDRRPRSLGKRGRAIAANASF